MREHEVPTHVQTEDKVLLWFTFPQIAAMLAAAGLAYALWRYAPGPQGFHIALAVAAALLEAAAAVGKIGGRRLPMMATDLLRFHLPPTDTKDIRPNWRVPNRQPQSRSDQAHSPRSHEG